MSYSLLAKVKKKGDKSRLFDPLQANILSLAVQQRSKHIFTPVPIRANVKQTFPQEIGQEGPVNVETDLIAALLKVNSEDRFPALNLLASLLKVPRNSEVESTLSKLATPLHATSELHSYSG